MLTKIKLFGPYFFLVSCNAFAELPVVKWHEGAPFPPQLEIVSGQPIPPLIVINEFTDIPQICDREISEAIPKPGWSTLWMKLPPDPSAKAECIKSKKAEYAAYEQSWYSAKKAGDEEEARQEAQKEEADREARAVDELAEQKKRDQQKADDERIIDARYASQQKEADARREAWRASEAAAAAKFDALKRECGDDFQKPRLGMSFARANKCISPTLRLVAQINRTDGVRVSSYENCCFLVHVINGQIAAWERQ